MGPDLHIHSTASDGTLTPEAIVERALEYGIPTIALTDHDTVAGVRRAQIAAEGTSLTVIPAVELSAEAGDRAIHILGYWIDQTDCLLNERLAAQRTKRLARAERIVEALAASNSGSVTMRDILDVASGASIGRSHVAHALMRAGHVSSIADAFERYLGEGRPGYVRKTVPTPDEVIAWIRDAGGLPILAHPALSAVDDLIPDLVAAGLLGIEAYHAECSTADSVRYARMADEGGLLVTGGSDFHGDSRPANQLGAALVPDGVLEALNMLRTSLGGAA